MGLSNEKFEEIRKMEGRLERGFVDATGNQVLSIKKFYNWGPCEFSGSCSFEKVRLGLAIVKNQKYCSDNPGIKECGAYQYLKGLASED